MVYITRCTVHPARMTLLNKKLQPEGKVSPSPDNFLNFTLKKFINFYENFPLKKFIHFPKNVSLKKLTHLLEKFLPKKKSTDNYEIMGDLENFPSSSSLLLCRVTCARCMVSLSRYTQIIRSQLKTIKSTNIYITKCLHGILAQT